MPASIDAQSYYQASAHSFPQQPRLKSDLTADICIIGAGYTGLSAALELAEAGYKVIVLEAREIGYGASGRNGGQICTGFSPGQQRIEAQLGKEDAIKCFAIAEEAKKLIDNLPSLSSWEQLMYEIYGREAIENGLVDSIEGRKASVEDVRAEFDLPG